MELINGILSVFTIGNLLYCFIGCLLGTLVGVLPGLGPASSLSILLPLTVYLDPTGSIIMLAGIYYGTMYGGSTTSILLNIPGEAASVPTTFDGFQMTKMGRGGEALWIAAMGSFIAGTLGCIGICIIGPGIAKYALKFGPPEYFGLLLFSLTMLISLSGKSIIKGAMVGFLGICLATLGIDPMTGTTRLNFSIIGLMRGFDIVPMVVGLFGIGEIIFTAEQGIQQIYKGKLGKMLPAKKELQKGLKASLRGSAIGFPLGLLPGMVAALSSFMAYDFEKRISKYPEKFGTGIIEGVAAPEAANNATAQAGFIPLMALGIPTGPSLAIILAALMMYGVQPGPRLFQQNSEFIWAVIGSMYIGNIILLILNLPLIGIWARIALIPYKYLAPIVLAICVIGAYSPRNTMFDVWVALFFGIMGYWMRRAEWPLAPLILGFILGPMFEQALRQSLSMGGYFFFLYRPITLVFIVMTIIIIALFIKYLRAIPESS